MVAAARTRPGTARQVIDITVRGGYRPAVVEAQAGVPLRLVFHREETEACSERVVFSSPRIDRRLAPGVATVIDLPAQPVGEVRYTCGMGRYRGRIRFQHARGAGSRLRRFVEQRQGGLGVGAVVGLCGLPLVVLLISFLFGTALWPAMGIALLSWLAGCLLMGSLLEHGTDR
jgi:Uncharacterized protein conserved in bacteria